MSTLLILKSLEATEYYYNHATGEAWQDDPANNTQANPWRGYYLGPNRGSSTLTLTDYTLDTSAFVALGDGLGTNLVRVFQSAPLITSSITISGTITSQFWAQEDSGKANAAMNFRVYVRRAQTTLLELIGESNLTTELDSMSPTNYTPSITPTSTTLYRGDRIVVIPGVKGAGASMASGYTWTLTYNQPSTNQVGDCYVQFTEDFSLYSSEPAGTTLYFTNTAASGLGAPPAYSEAFASDTGDWYPDQPHPGFSDWSVCGIAHEPSDGNTANGCMRLSADQADNTTALVRLPGTYEASTQYTVTFYTKYVSGQSSWNWIFGSDRTTGDRATGSATLGTSWTERTVSWTPSSDRTDAIFCLRTNGAGAAEALFDDISISPAPGNNVGNEMWTSRGGSATTSDYDGYNWRLLYNQSAARYSAFGLKPIVDFYTKPLEATDLTSCVRVNSRFSLDVATANGGILIAQVAVTDEDGNLKSVYGYGARNGVMNTTTETVYAYNIGGPTISLVDGDRIRLRFLLADGYGGGGCVNTSQTYGDTFSVHYNGPTASASGDAWMQVQTNVDIVEYTGGGGGGDEPFPYIGGGYYG